MTTPTNATAIRRFADTNSSRITAATEATRLIVATVATVTAGAASDGNALVKLTWRGVPCTANGYLASYTPIVGHTVLCAYLDNQLIIHGRIIGQP